MIDQVPLLTVVLLCLAALVAGWVDSVVGGGGIIQLPSLLIGLPATTPVATVSGTNKLSSVAGTTMAAGTYLSKVKIHWPTTLVLIAAAYGGSTVGANLVQYVSRTLFLPVMAVVVAGIGLYTWRRPQLGQRTRLKHTGGAHWVVTAALGLVVGLWDGVIGPGTGVFFVIGLVAALGYGFLEATTMTKLANLTTNVAALVVLGTAGHVLWALGACMAVCNCTGAALGSRMA
ncbi:MAG: TSUP family transporter, partial [Propionibacteriaceae bacterium]|nr:TSUP family transporter [Propionibacteriaceae bacterium]